MSSCGYYGSDCSTSEHIETCFCKGQLFESNPTLGTHCVDVDRCDTYANSPSGSALVAHLWEYAFVTTSTESIWGIILAVIFGILLGTLLGYLIMYLRKRKKNKVKISPTSFSDSDTKYKIGSWADMTNFHSPFHGVLQITEIELAFQYMDTPFKGFNSFDECISSKNETSRSLAVLLSNQVYKDVVILQVAFLNERLACFYRTPSLKISETLIREHLAAVTSTLSHYNDASNMTSANWAELLHYLGIHLTCVSLRCIPHSWAELNEILRKHITIEASCLDADTTLTSLSSILADLHQNMNSVLSLKAMFVKYLAKTIERGLKHISSAHAQSTRAKVLIEKGYFTAKLEEEENRLYDSFFEKIRSLRASELAATLSRLREEGLDNPLASLNQENSSSSKEKNSPTSESARSAEYIHNVVTAILSETNSFKDTLNVFYSTSSLSWISILSDILRLRPELSASLMDLYNEVKDKFEKKHKKEDILRLQTRQILHREAMNLYDIEKNLLHALHEEFFSSLVDWPHTVLKTLRQSSEHYIAASRFVVLPKIFSLIWDSKDRFPLAPTLSGENASASSVDLSQNSTILSVKALLQEHMTHCQNDLAIVHASFLAFVSLRFDVFGYAEMARLYHSLPHAHEGEEGRREGSSDSSTATPPSSTTAAARKLLIKKHTSKVFALMQSHMQGLHTSALNAIADIQATLTREKKMIKKRKPRVSHSENSLTSEIQQGTSGPVLSFSPVAVPLLRDYHHRIAYYHNEHIALASSLRAEFSATGGMQSSLGSSSTTIDQAHASWPSDGAPPTDHGDENMAKLMSRHDLIESDLLSRSPLKYAPFLLRYKSDPSSASSKLHEKKEAETLTIDDASRVAIEEIIIFSSPHLGSPALQAMLGLHKDALGALQATHEKAIASLENKLADEASGIERRTMASLHATHQKAMQDRFYILDQRQRLVDVDNRKVREETVAAQDAQKLRMKLQSESETTKAKLISLLHEKKLDRVKALKDKNQESLDKERQTQLHELFEAERAVVKEKERESIRAAISAEGVHHAQEIVRRIVGVRHENEISRLESQRKGDAQDALNMALQHIQADQHYQVNALNVRQKAEKDLAEEEGKRWGQDEVNRQSELLSQHLDELQSLNKKFEEAQAKCASENEAVFQKATNKMVSYLKQIHSNELEEYYREFLPLQKGKSVFLREDSIV